MCIDDRNIKHLNENSLTSRVFYVALPFIALHKPFGKTITLVMDSLRTVSSFKQLVNSQNSKQLLTTIVAISALVGTILAHPLGMCISTLYDLGYDITIIISKLQLGLHKEALYTLLSMTQHLLYLGTLVAGSLQIIALSMLANMAFEIARSHGEFKKEKFLEGSAHLLMSLVRFAQVLPHVENIAHNHDMKGKDLSSSAVKTAAKIRDKTASYFYRAGRFCVGALWKSTESWLSTVSICNDEKSSTSTKTLAVAKSTISSLALLPISLGGLVIGQTLHFSAYLLSTTPYIHLEGNAENKDLSDKEISLFQLNCCLPSGGFSRMFGGLTLPNDERVQKIIEMIKENNPDIVCMQEVSDLNDAFAFYNNLSDEYTDFYFNMGATPFILQNTSGLFVASKTNISNPNLHSFSDIDGTESMVNKCYFQFSVGDIANFITTHLSPSSDDLTPTDAEVSTRRAELERIYLAAERKAAENGKPTFVMGDLNINWDSEEHRTSAVINEASDEYNKDRESVSEEEATAETDYLKDRNWHHNENSKPQNLILDYFLSLFNTNPSLVVSTKKVNTFEDDSPELAVSDHAGLITNINLN